MAVEYFKSVGRYHEPVVSLYNTGLIALNCGAMIKCKIEHGCRVMLGYDREKKIIVIDLLKPNEPHYGSARIRAKNSSCLIPAIGFFRYFEIRPTGKAKRYTPQISENRIQICLDGKAE